MTYDEIAKAGKDSPENVLIDEKLKELAAKHGLTITIDGDRIILQAPETVSGTFPSEAELRRYLDKPVVVRGKFQEPAVRCNGYPRFLVGDKLGLAEPVTPSQKHGRNAACRCGSGRKYKLCCWGKKRK